MQFNNPFGVDESQLERNIRSIIDSTESNQSNLDIERYVSYLWQKVVSPDNRPGKHGSTNNETTTSGHPNIDLSTDISTTTLPILSSTQSSGPPSPSILADIGTFTTTQSDQSKHESRKRNEPEECCKNQLIMKRLSRLSYIEFNNQKLNFLTILKEVSIQVPTNPIFYYIMDNSIHVKTNSMILQIQNLRNMQYVVCEGYKTTLIFCDYILTAENFMYFALLSQSQIVSFHTCANLCLNHLTVNRLPMYMSLSSANKSKFVRVFLKLSRLELHYNAIKSRITAITNHNRNCKEKK